MREAIEEMLTCPRFELTEYHTRSVIEIIAKLDSDEFLRLGETKPNLWRKSGALLEFIGEPLDAIERRLVAEVLRYILCGRDARKALGVVPHGGKPSQIAIDHGVQAGMAADFLQLRESQLRGEETNTSEKWATCEIARLYGVKPDRVRVCVRQYRKRYASLSKTAMVRQLSHDAYGFPDLERERMDRWGVTWSEEIPDF